MKNEKWKNKFLRVGSVLFCLLHFTFYILEEVKMKNGKWKNRFLRVGFSFTFYLLHFTF